MRTSPESPAPEGLARLALSLLQPRGAGRGGAGRGGAGRGEARRGGARRGEARSSSSPGSPPPAAPARRAPPRRRRRRPPRRARPGRSAQPCSRLCGPWPRRPQGLDSLRPSPDKELQYSEHAVDPASQTLHANQKQREPENGFVGVGSGVLQTDKCCMKTPEIASACSRPERNRLLGNSDSGIPQNGHAKSGAVLDAGPAPHPSGPGSRNRLFAGGKTSKRTRPRT